MPTLLPSQELALLWVKSVGPIYTKMVSLSREIVKAFPSASKLHSLTESLADTLAATQGVADMMGRRRLLLEMDANRSKAPRMTSYDAADAKQPLIPDVKFHDAIVDMVSRDPRLARGAEAVAETYSTQHAFAAAKSASLEITKRVQGAVVRGIREGTPEGTAGKIIAAIADWTRAYAETVFRTNVATAYSAGRFRQAFEIGRAHV